MILLNNQSEEFLKKRFGNIKANKERVVIKGNEHKFIIPSDLYPLQNKKHIRLFCSANTLPIEDEIIVEVFNEEDLPVGRCYSNTTSLYKRLLEKGIPEQDIKPYVGWIIIDGIPIHHCWLVYQDVSLLDGGVSVSNLKYYEQLNQLTDINEQRNLLAKLVQEDKNKPNTETKTFGQVVPVYVYVGSKGTPQEGASLFQKLMSEHPQHPSYASSGMNGNGMSKMQEILYHQSNKL